MLSKAYRVIELCREKNMSISELTIDFQLDELGIDRNTLLQKMHDTYNVMKRSAEAGLNTEIYSLSGMTGGNAKKINEYRQSSTGLSGDFILEAMARAFSTSEINASMGKIVAAPTAGASGIMPAALTMIQKKKQLSDSEIVKALFTAATIGGIIALNATISGSEGGCQAECGSAAAMTAAALVELSGGTVEQSFTAAGFALINIMGLICDPVGGYVEFPCALRNASGVVNAIVSADMALANVLSLIPFDEVVAAMSQVGNIMSPTLKETALGGIAASPSAQKYNQ